MSILLPVRRAGEVVAFTTVDEDKAEFLSQWRWSLNGRGYVMGSPGLMHRVVLGIKKGTKAEVDHRNRDKLDNRVSNLRLVTHSENVQNSTRYFESQELRRQIVELFEAGHSRREIAALLGVSYGVVGLRLKGRPAFDKTYWTRDRIAQAIRDFHDREGRLPKQTEMKGRDGLPWFTQVYRQFDSIDDAVLHAGLTPRYYLQPEKRAVA